MCNCEKGNGRPGKAEQHSTRITFFIAGFGMAAWAPLVPFAKARVGLDEGMLGLLLLCLGGRLESLPCQSPAPWRLGSAVSSSWLWLPCRSASHLPLLAIVDSLLGWPWFCSPSPRSRDGRLHGEYPGDHRRTRWRVNVDVGVSRPVQSGGILGAAGVRRVAQPGDAAGGPRCGWLFCILVAITNGLPPHLLPVWKRGARAGVCGSPEGSCCSSSAVLRRLSHRGGDAGTEARSS